jgi:hypothetical protein
MVSERYLKRRIKRQFIGPVSKRSLVYLKAYCENLIDDVIRKAIEEFQEHNRFRQIHGLPELKRIPANLFKNLRTILFKPEPDLNNGKAGEDNRKTALQTDADERWYYA